MLQLEEYLEHADELAQQVVNAWGVNVQAGNSGLFTPEFNSLLDKAFLYRDMRKLADNHREFNMLGKQEEAEEKATRQAFAEAYKAFDEKRSAAS